MYLSIVCGMFVCVSLSINVCMFTVSLSSAVFVECLVLNPCCVVMFGMFCVM